MDEQNLLERVRDMCHRKTANNFVTTEREHEVVQLLSEISDKLYEMWIAGISVVRKHDEGVLSSSPYDSVAIERLRKAAKDIKP